jgi:hypothetical protein
VQNLRVRLVIWRSRVNLQLTESSGKGNVLFTAYGLVAEKNYLVFQQGFPDLGNQGFIGISEIRTEQFSPDRR